MTEVFATEYAEAYDLLYADKDYEGECDLIEQVFRRYAGSPVSSVLDLGCGTGGHAVRLAQRGYAMTGVDRSTAMLARAAANMTQRRVSLSWVEGDIRAVQAGGPFDAALMMFGVLSYQLTNEDVMAALTTARDHLDSGGLLVLDAWHGPGVLTDPPQSRTKAVQRNGRSFVRHTTAQLDVRNHLCSVHYYLSGTPAETRETHVVRFFFPRELELYLELAGFEPLLLAPFGALEAPLGEDAWNIMVVARAQ